MRLQQRECYQADNGRCSHKQRIAYFPFKQDDQATYGNQQGKPVADGNLAQQQTSP